MEYSLNEIQQVGKFILSKAQHQALLFYGEMGVGKTTLIKVIVQLLGSSDQVSSPTFSLVNEYHYPHGKIFHFDLYRIKQEEEVADIGFEDYFYEAKDWQFIEWPEMIPNLLPEEHTAVHVELLASGKRKINLVDS